jgi:hypothetical protein
MEIIIKDTEEKITCRICGAVMKNIAGKHIQVKHNITCEEYKKLYPGAPTQSNEYKKATSKNSGQHMKQEKYKKMFSDKFKGEKNPAHSSKTTMEERKSRSPFSKDFVGYKDVLDKESRVKEFAKNALKDRVSNNQVQYWIDRGYSEDESKVKVSERQKTFTLDKCIEKYGEEEGKKVYTDRQNKWQNSLLSNGNLKYGYSSISQELFYSIILEYKNIKELENVFFATKNKEFRLNKKESSIWIYDFTDLNKKKIIEYNGDQYHGNPLIFKSSDNPHPFRKYITAEEMWQKDVEKIKIAEENGFEVLTIWDSEYKKDKLGILQKCLDFLKIKNK